MARVLKKPELLAPAGTLEKLKMAIHYGADAVYIGGLKYGLRSRAGNFTFEEMEEGLDFARKRNAKVYVAANIVSHEADIEGAGDYFRTLRDIGVDAVIVSDPALIEICASEAPGLPIHLSTQASVTNFEALNFWKEEGLERVVLAREVSMEEIKEIRQKTDIELEAFIHGAKKRILNWKHLFTVQCAFPIQDAACFRTICHSVMQTAADVRSHAGGNMTCLKCLMLMNASRC